MISGTERPRLTSGTIDNRAYASRLSDDISSHLPLELQEINQRSTLGASRQYYCDDCHIRTNALHSSDEENFSQLPTVFNSTEITRAPSPTVQQSRAPSVSKTDEFKATDTERNQPPPLEVPYHVFGRSQKNMIILLVSLAASFSPLSSNIYFPALNLIADTLNTSNSAVALSVSVYMIGQGIAPSFWGPLADILGRRQILIYTLLLYVASNFGLALTTSFPLLMVFRFLQAVGSSSTISIGAGIIADIATPAERGGLLGTFSGVRQFALAIGPVLGGVISEVFGYHAIFWFLVVLGAIAVIAIALFLPETLRRIAGNGSVQLSGVQFEPLSRKLWPSEKSSKNQLSIPPREQITWHLFLGPLKFLLEKDVACILFFGAIVYTVWSMVTSSTSVLLSQNYHLNVLDIGLCFLANGSGCVIGSYVAGRQLDSDFRSAQESYQYRCGSTNFSRGDLPDDFPLEHARLSQLTTLVPMFVFATFVYGFGIGPSINLALPLMAQFMIGYSSTAVLNLNNTLTVDLYPGKSASATAVNNLARCSLGALGVSLTDIALKKIKPHVLFSVLGAIVVVSSITILLEWRYGMRWRCERTKRLPSKTVLTP